jgi:ADP-heptose:LPS heptosyltransferase
VLVLRPGALGDTLLAVPALRALRKAGYAPITLAAHAGAARLLAQVGEIDVGMPFDDPSLSWLFDDSPVDKPLVAWLSATDSPALKTALIAAPGQPSTEQHCAEYLVSTLASLGIPLVVDDRPLRVSKAPRTPTDEVLVHVGSGSAAKNWPAERFAKTIRALKRPVRLVVGEADAVSAANVDACLGRPLPRLENQTLGELAARLAGCHAYLGNDSGVSHLAGLCGARTGVLFGPTSPVVWRPLGPDVHVIPFDTQPEQVADLLGA